MVSKQYEEAALKMVSKQYEEAAATLDRMAEQTKRIQITNAEFERAVKDHQALTEHLNTATEIFVPLMKNYLDNLMAVRMSLGREVQDILRHSAELKKAADGSQALAVLVRDLEKLKAVLTPEFIEIVKKING